jgi:hypothetical protein
MVQNAMCPMFTFVVVLMTEIGHIAYGTECYVSYVYIRCGTDDRNRTHSLWYRMLCVLCLHSLWY